MDARHKKLLEYGQELENEILEVIDNFLGKNDSKLSLGIPLPIILISLYAVTRSLFCMSDKSKKHWSMLEKKFQRDSMACIDLYEKIAKDNKKC